MAIERRSQEAQTAVEIQAQIDEAKEGAIIHVSAGRIRGRLVIDKPITLRGAGAERTVFDAKGKGAVIAIDAPGGDVRIEEMSITGGRSSHGGAISIDNGAQVYVVGCLLEKNSARSGRGGAISVDKGGVFIAECTLVQNQAQLGGALFIGGDARAEVAATIIAENVAIKGGGIAVLDGAEIEVFTSRLLQNRAEVEGHHIYTYGASARRPAILLSNTVLGQADAIGSPISNCARYRAGLVVDNTMIGREHMPTSVVA
jgi:hypothetical protein